MNLNLKKRANFTYRYRFFFTKIWQNKKILQIFDKMLSTIEEESFNKSKFGLSICLFKRLYLFVSFFICSFHCGFPNQTKHVSDNNISIFKDLSIIFTPFAVRVLYECLSPFLKMATDMWFDSHVCMNPIFKLVDGKRKY